MKKIISHFKRTVIKFGALIILATCISIVYGILLWVLLSIISLLFFPISEKRLEDYFSDEEMKKIENDEELDNEEFLSFAARFQSYRCPVKIDQHTTWVGSEVTSDSYICHYEFKISDYAYSTINWEATKENSLNNIPNDDQRLEVMVETNRKLIYQYTNIKTGEVKNLVWDVETLRNKIQS